MFIVLLEDLTDLVGIVVGFVGIVLSVSFKSSVYDGVASMAIGVIFAVTAVYLVNQTRRLLIGTERNGVRPNIVSTPVAVGNHCV